MPAIFFLSVAKSIPLMNQQPTVAIVGGGPSGALAGALLAPRWNVHIFDEKLAWEKPCGGGLTFKALRQYPFLADAAAESNSVEHCEIISPSGQRVRFRMQHPVAVFSRFTLNGLLLDHARAVGANLHRERVTAIGGQAGDWRIGTPNGEYRASYLLLAAGARNPFRSPFVSHLSADDLLMTAGYFIPVRTSLMQIQFLSDIGGYIWIFPRLDHVSAGIAGRLGETSTRDLRRILEHWLRENGFSLDGARFYAHILPSFRAQTLDALRVSGDGCSVKGRVAIRGTGIGIRSMFQQALGRFQITVAGRRHQSRVTIELSLPHSSVGKQHLQRGTGPGDPSSSDHGDATGPCPMVEK